MAGKQQLAQFDNSWYNPGGSSFKRVLWYITNAVFFNSSFPINGIKLFLLKLFGCKVGRGIVLKPHVNIKYPWKLTIGNHVWIGESVWIDNLDEIFIGDNVCISQGALLLCGNHNYKKTGFDLITGKIKIDESAWIGAKSIVCPGVTIGENAILMVNSVATRDLDPNGIYRGNPAIKVKER